MLSRDTTRDAESLQISLMRSASAADKLRAAGELTEAAVLLALVGLRTRHSEASETQIRARLARLIVGEDLACRAYGPEACQGAS